MSKSLDFLLKFSFGGLISAAISFLSTPLITSLILPEEFGRASMVILAVSLLINFVLLGIDQSFVRFYYDIKYVNGKNLLISNSIIVPILLSLVIIGGILYFNEIVSDFLINSIDFRVIVILSFMLFVGVIERFTTLFIRMEQKAVLFSTLKIVQSISNIIIIVLYTKFYDMSFHGILVGSLISSLLITGLGVWYEREVWRKAFSSFNKIEVKNLIIYGLPFLPTFIISWLFEGIDKLALKHYSTFTEIGYYSAAYKIVAILSILQVTFSNVWIPISYEVYEKNTIKAKEFFVNVFNGISGVFFIISILLISFKDLIVKLFNILLNLI